MGCGVARACLAWQGKGDVKSPQGFGALDMQAQGPHEITPIWARLDDGQGWMMARTVRRKWGEMFGCRLKSVDYSG